MARRRSRSRTLNRIAGPRIAFPIARRSLVPAFSRSRPRDLLPFEDRRRFHPLRGFRPPLSISRRDQRRLIAPSPRSLVRREVFKFAVPKKVLICVRRKERREVLFARRGLRSGGAKRRNEWSDVSCR